MKVHFVLSFFFIKVADIGSLLFLNTTILTNKNKMNAKLLEFSSFQGKPLQENNTSIKALDDIERPIFIEMFLSYGPKHPIRDKFNEIHF